MTTMAKQQAHRRADRHETVGHEWDGIEELNTPLPRWWLWTFYACIVWAIGYVVLLSGMAADSVLQRQAFFGLDQPWPAGCGNDRGQRQTCARSWPPCSQPAD
jgi:hypothetical protein